MHHIVIMLMLTGAIIQKKVVCWEKKDHDSFHYLIKKSNYHGSCIVFQISKAVCSEDIK